MGLSPTTRYREETLGTIDDFDLEAEPEQDPLIEGLVEGTVAYLQRDRRVAKEKKNKAVASPGPAKGSTSA